MEAITQPKGMFNETFHGLTTDELRLIIPIIKRGHRHAEKMVNHYRDLTEDGFGTSRQSTAILDWQDKAEKLEKIINYANTVLK